MVPLGVTAWLVWSRNLSFGYWFVTSQCLAWTLGTLSYYALPTLGPGLEYVCLYKDLADTPTSDLMDSLVERPAGRPARRARGTGAVGRRVRQPALRDHAAARADGAVHDPVDGSRSGSCGSTSASPSSPPSTSAGTTSPTTSRGIVIAMVSFYIGGVASGQKFDRGLTTSHPTTTTAAVPVGRDS